MTRRITLLAYGALALFIVIQLVPYGRDHDNPPVTAEPAWDSAETERLVRAACFDCHSNETVWPWYAQLAPVSWLMQRDVDTGREELNLSEMDREQDKLEDVVETIVDGEMPPWRYTIMHPEARLTEEQKAALINGLVATFGPEVDTD